MFSVHSTPEKVENATITDHFRFVFEENSSREIIATTSLSKSSVLKLFSVYAKSKSTGRVFS